MGKVLKLHYHYSKNFGDNLNAYIFEKCFNVKIKYTHSCFADAIGIGSILDRCLLTTKDIFYFLLSKILFFNKPLYILSSGFSKPCDEMKKKARYFKSLILKRKLAPIIVRGGGLKENLKKF